MLKRIPLNKKSSTPHTHKRKVSSVPCNTSILDLNNTTTMQGKKKNVSAKDMKYFYQHDQQQNVNDTLRTLSN